MEHRPVVGDRLALKEPDALAELLAKLGRVRAAARGADRCGPDAVQTAGESPVQAGAGASLRSSRLSGSDPGDDAWTQSGHAGRESRGTRGRSR